MDPGRIALEGVQLLNWPLSRKDNALKLASGIDIQEVQEGTGAEVVRGSNVTIMWRGTLNHGDEFGSGESTFRAGGREVIAGLSRGVIGMRVGGTRRIRVGPHLGYRDESVPGIPANAVLSFEVKVLSLN